MHLCDDTGKKNLSDWGPLISFCCMVCNYAGSVLIVLHVLLLVWAGLGVVIKSQRLFDLERRLCDGGSEGESELCDADGEPSVMSFRTF